MTITVRLTEQAMVDTGICAVTRRYEVPGMSFMACLEDLLRVAELTGADVLAVELS